MESWIVIAVQITLSMVTLIATVIAIQWARSGAKEGRAARKLVEALTEAFRKGHGYPDPSAAAVVTDPCEASSPAEASPEPAPAMARAALPATEPQQGRTRGVEETRRSRLRLVTRDEGGEARAGIRAEQRKGTMVEWVDFDEEETALFDEMAAERGLTRDEMLSVLLKRGLPLLEGPRKK